MTYFNPAIHGFAFPNTFDNRIEVGVFGMDFRTSGLCGGMSYAALDYYHSRMPIPNQWYRPAETTDLQSYIYNRQTISLWSNTDRWSELTFNPGGVRDSEFFEWGLRATNGGQLQFVLSTINAGAPGVLNLKGKNGTGDHQVIVFGYDLGAYNGDLGANQRELKIYVLDPNYPRETRTLVPNPEGKYYTYAENPGAQTWLTYFVDPNYHILTPPPVYVPNYPKDGSARALVFEIRTGGDDLRGGNDNVNLAIDLLDGSHLVFGNINGSGKWMNNTTMFIRVELPRAVPESEILRYTLDDTFGGGIAGDNWNMDYTQVYVENGDEHHALGGRSGSWRFTGNVDPYTVELSQPDGLVTKLAVDLVTGGDDLRGGNDNVDLTVVLRNGESQVVSNINRSCRYEDNSTHTETIYLRRPVPVSALSRIVLSTHFGGGMFGDNWNLNGGRVRALGKNIAMEVGTIPSIRFTGDVHDLSVPVHGEVLSSPDSDSFWVSLAAANKCVGTANGGSMANGTRAIVWDCHGNSDQRWVLTATGLIKNPITDKCIGMDNGGSLANGTAAIVYDCHGNYDQRWTMTGENLLRNSAGNKCLGLSNGGSTANGTELVIWDCHGNMDQQWNMKRGTSLTWRMSQAGARCVGTDNGGSMANGTNPIMWDCHGNSDQQWFLTPDGLLKNLDGNKCIGTANGGSMANGTEAILWDCHGNADQRWALDSTGLLRNTSSGKCIGSANYGSSANGTRLILWDCHGNVDQHWSISR